MCLRILYVLCTFVHIFLYSPPPSSVCRRLDARDRCYEISRPKSWRPSFFLSYLSLLFRRTTRLPQPPPPPPRGREAHNKGNATRFDFERARSRHLTPWPTDRPTGQGRVRPEFARRDANTQIIRVYYYYYYFYYQ